MMKLYTRVLNSLTKNIIFAKIKFILLVTLTLEEQDRDKLELLVLLEAEPEDMNFCYAKE